MTTWAQLQTDIRTDLKDTGSTKRWSDDVIYLYVKDAIRDYSLYFPRRMKVTLPVTDLAAALPSDYLGAPRVECPASRFLEERMERLGATYRNQARPTAFYVEGGKILLNGEAEELTFTYDALHPIPTSVADAAFELTIPLLDEELIRLYVKAKATEQVRTNQSNLDRFKLGSGKRDDNPMEPETANLMDEYLAKVAERFPGGVIRLWRPGRAR